MSRGYSLRLRDLNAKADKRKLGVRLGRLCIKQDVPVAVVARTMGVTRTTVYNWFCGASAPQPALASAIETYIAKLENAAA
jgi:DNA-binding transcriptional regulator YiaG